MNITVRTFDKRTKYILTNYQEDRARIPSSEYDVSENVFRGLLCKGGNYILFCSF